MSTPTKPRFQALTVADAFTRDELRKAQWHLSICTECERRLWRDLCNRLHFDHFEAVARILWHWQDIRDQLRDAGKAEKENDHEPF